VNYTSKTGNIFFQDADDFICNSICKFMGSVQNLKTSIMSCHTIILWVARGLWYYVETPGLPKVDVWIIIIEFVTFPV